MDKEPRLIRLAVFGKPVAHSLSPRIHGLFAAQFGLPLDYRAIEADAKRFARRVARFAQEGGRGCNVTVPLKREAWKLATERSPGAQRAQAVNTLLFREDDTWFGDNTDGEGLVRDLERAFAGGLADRRICLLGAGGAAAGVLGALLEAAPGAVVLVNRTPARAEDLAARHSDLGRVETCSFEQTSKAGPFDLLVNATSMGHAGSAPPLERGWFKAGGLCYDMNYGKASEPLQAVCLTLGVRACDGLGMLVEQAALSFQLWTGLQASTTPVLDELRRSLG